MDNESEDAQQKSFLRFYDILFIDFFFDEINDWFLNWVIEEYPERFTESELDEMRAQAVSHLDFYEVQEVIPGKGSLIKSLYTQHEGFLKDISSSFCLVKWDIILTRCYPYNGHYVATGSLNVFHPSEKKLILEKIEQAYSAYSDLFQDSEYAHFAKNRWDIFFQIEREIREKTKNKKFYTTYGEFQPCEVRFQVRDLKTIMDKMEFIAEFHFIDSKKRKDKKIKKEVLQYRFDWFTLGIEEKLEAIKTGQVEDGIRLFTHQLDLKGNQTGIEVIGTFFIDKFLARLDTRSIPLAEFAGRHFIELFGEALSFKRIVKTKMETKAGFESEKEQKESSKSIPPNPKLMIKLEEQYYLSQLDQKIPALNNMTPREARHDPAMLPLLVEWLKGIENIVERKRLAGEQVVSLKKIRKALDID